jgi:hypothetical protein
VRGRSDSDTLQSRYAQLEERSEDFHLEKEEEVVSNHRIRKDHAE